MSAFILLSPNSSTGYTDELRAKHRQHLLELNQKPDNAGVKTAAESSQSRLRIAIGKHRKSVAALAPQIPVEPLADEDPLHEAELILPSSLSLVDRTEYGWAQMAGVELKLRIGLIYDILQALKKALAVKSYLSRQSKQPSNKAHQTRSMSQVTEAAKKVDYLKKAYRRCFKTLLSLGPSTLELGNLQELKEEDVQMLSSWLEEERYKKASTLPGQGPSDGTSRELPWIWRISPIAVEPGEDVSEAVEKWNKEGMWLPPEARLSLSN